MSHASNANDQLKLAQQTLESLEALSKETDKETHAVSLSPLSDVIQSSAFASTRSNRQDFLKGLNQWIHFYLVNLAHGTHWFVLPPEVGFKLEDLPSHPTGLDPEVEEGFYSKHKKFYFLDNQRCDQPVIDPKMVRYFIAISLELAEMDKETVENLLQGKGGSSKSPSGNLQRAVFKRLLSQLEKEVPAHKEEAEKTYGALVFLIKHSEIRPEEVPLLAVFKKALGQ